MNIPKTPKTPSRHRTGSDAKTPGTPGAGLVAGLNALHFGSPTKRPSHKSSKSTSSNVFDTTNPFIASSAAPKSRPASPTKRGSGSVSESLQNQAGSGVIRKGGIESRLDYVTRDYVPPPVKHEVKRSRSTPGSMRDPRDRFITSREDAASTLDPAHLNTQSSSSPGHTARLAAAAGVPLNNRRVLGYSEPPPPPTTTPGNGLSATLLAEHREFSRPLYARPAALASSNGAIGKTRKISTIPERILDAPSLVDDFYLNLVSWSAENAVAVALQDSTYIWHADTGEVKHLGQAPAESYVSSVDFSNDGAYLGVGIGNGDVELWDVESGTKMRTMSGHQGQIAVMSWHQHILSSGCGDGSIWHHDGEVCGLKWREDGELCASGGNDNVVNVWDGRLGSVGEGAKGKAKWVKRNHTAAVKAIAWCPWQPSLLASGGGTNDATIHIWNTTTGARLHSTTTPSQVTSLIWSRHSKELLSTHGYPTNSIMVHSYPLMSTVAEIRDAHDSRVLFSSLSPGGDVVVTGAGDENLKFWRIWETPSGGKGGKGKRSGTAEEGGQKTRSGILSIR